MDKVDAGPKGAVISFHRDTFAKPEGLIAFIQKRANAVKLRPDHKLVFQHKWEDPADRARGECRLIDDLAGLAQGA